MQMLLDPEPGITVREVSKRFGGLQALSDVNLEAEPARVTGLIGPNGAGKSTLFNAITNIIAPDTGTVAIGGQDITGWETKDIVKFGVGRTFQTPRSFPSLSVLENVTVAADDTAQRLLPSLLGRKTARDIRDRAMAVLARIGLADRATVGADELSGGELRLLEVGRQLIREPRYLLLDEPTAGVSPDFQDKLLQLLKELRAEGTTLLCVEHNMRFLSDLADKLVVLEQGRIIAAGPPGDVLRDPHVVEAYLGGGVGTHVGD